MVNRLENTEKISSVLQLIHSGLILEDDLPLSHYLPLHGVVHLIYHNIHPKEDSLPAISSRFDISNFWHPAQSLQSEKGMSLYLSCLYVISDHFSKDSGGFLRTEHVRDLQQSFGLCTQTHRFWTRCYCAVQPFQEEEYLGQ